MKKVICALLALLNFQTFGMNPNVDRYIPTKGGSLCGDIMPDPFERNIPSWPDERLLDEKFGRSQSMHATPLNEDQAALLAELDYAQTHNQDIKPILERSTHPYELIVAKTEVFSIFHEAAILNRLENIKLYIKIAENTNNVQDLLSKEASWGNTALDAAKLHEHTEIVQLLELCAQNNAEDEKDKDKKR